MFSLLHDMLLGKKNFFGAVWYLCPSEKNKVFLQYDMASRNFYFMVYFAIGT